MNYSIELFFKTFSSAKKIDIFLFQSWESLTFNQFSNLPNCEFILLGCEWVKSGNTISKKVK